MKQFCRTGIVVFWAFLLTACNTERGISDYPYAVWVSQEDNIWFEYFGDSNNYGMIYSGDKAYEISVVFPESSNGDIEFYLLDPIMDAVQRGEPTIYSITDCECILRGSCIFKEDGFTLHIKEKNKKIFSEDLTELNFRIVNLETPQP